MPATFDAQFARWLTQHGEPRAQGVNVLQFSHERVPPAFPTQYVSDYGEPFAATTETGVHFVAEPLGFLIDIAADNLTTEQRVMIRMDNANGLVMDQIRRMTLDDLQRSIVITYRVYLNTKRTAPAFDPVVLYAARINATRLAVELEASADQLPNVTAGIRYTLERFPSLAYL